MSEKTGDRHWAGNATTSLHGNGPASFVNTTRSLSEVTCRLCLSQIKRAGWIDKQGDVWSLGDDGLMHTPETRPFPLPYVERKWGPLRYAGDLEALLPPAKDARP